MGPLGGLCLQGWNKPWPRYGLWTMAKIVEPVTRNPKTRFQHCQKLILRHNCKHIILHPTSLLTSPRKFRIFLQPRLLPILSISSVDRQTACFLLRQSSVLNHSSYSRSRPLNVVHWTPAPRWLVKRAAVQLRLTADELLTLYCTVGLNLIMYNGALQIPWWWWWWWWCLFETRSFIRAHTHTDND